MESIAVVKRRGCDFWPCTKGFGGPVCRVGGKLHRAQPLLGKQTGVWRLCYTLRRELVLKHGPWGGVCAETCSWCGHYDGECFSCGRCFDCGMPGNGHFDHCWWHAPTFRVPV